MKLTELHAHFLDSGDRRGIGVEMDCPCGCEFPLYVPFVNPLDGGKPHGGVLWMRTGDTIETLSLVAYEGHPQFSVWRGVPCPNRWHGYITNGETKPA